MQGHILNDWFIDDNDIMREVMNLFIRTNMLISRFKKCSTRIKTKLFRAYCLGMYDLALWHSIQLMFFYSGLSECHRKVHRESAY